MANKEKELTREELVEKIKHYLDDGFEKELLDVALMNLDMEDNPVRLNNFCYLVRGLGENFLERLAPDEKLKKCCWINKNKLKSKQYIDKQRPRYVMHGGLDYEYVKKELNIKVDEYYNEILGNYKTLSEYTHIKEEFYKSSKEITNKVSYSALKTLLSLFKTMEECKRKIKSKLKTKIDSTVIFELVTNSISSLEDITHYYSVEEVTIKKKSIIEINEYQIEMEILGNAYCEISIGESKELLEAKPQNFPAGCKILIDVENTDNISVEDESTWIDTSEWDRVMHEELYK